MMFTQGAQVLLPLTPTECQYLLKATVSNTCLAMREEPVREGAHWEDNSCERYSQSPKLARLFGWGISVGIPIPLTIAYCCDPETSPQDLDSLTHNLMANGWRTF